MTGYRLNFLDMLIRNFTIFFMVELRIFSCFMNMSQRSVGNVVSFTRGSLMWVGEVISHKKLVSLLLAPEMWQCWTYQHSRRSPRYAVPIRHHTIWDRSPIRGTVWLSFTSSALIINKRDRITYVPSKSKLVCLVNVQLQVLQGSSSIERRESESLSER